MLHFPHGMRVVWCIIESFPLIPTVAQVGKKPKLITENCSPKEHMFMHLNISENWG